MKKSRLLLSVLSTFLFVTPLAHAVCEYHDTFICSKKVPGYSRFACVTHNQNHFYTDQYPVFFVELTNIGKHPFRLHPHGRDIAPGETTDSLPISNHKLFHASIDDSELFLHRSDYRISERTLTAKVDVTYYAYNCT